MADQLFESAAALLTAGIGFYHAQQVKEKRKKLEKLQKRWTLPRGTILVLKTDLYLREYGGTLNHKWFDVGYAPMLLEVYWPKLAETANETQNPVVFHLWCGGFTYTHSVRLDDWGNALPFEVLCDDKAI